MTKNNNPIQEKSISEQLSVVWAKLSKNQRRYVVASQECATKKEAAELIGMEPDTIYRWPSVVEEAVELFSLDVKQAVEGVLKQSAAKAAMVKATGLDSDDEKIRQGVATEIIDRIMGKATQRQEITGVDGTPLLVIDGRPKTD